LTKEDQQLLLSIADDGNGLSPLLQSGGFGLVSMRERANALGAKFTISNNDLKGVTIRVEFDLSSPIFTEATT
jgi:signal transduction histidine kinase